MNTSVEAQIDPDPDSFLMKYCQRQHCAPEDFAVRVLWHCMHRAQMPLARLIWLFNADFFLSDLDLINQVKDATTSAKVREIVKFFSKEPSYTNFWRRTLKIRISRSKLLKLAAAELGETKPDADLEVKAENKGESSGNPASS